jgi:hypothetical protein
VNEGISLDEATPGWAVLMAVSTLVADVLGVALFVVIWHPQRRGSLNDESAKSHYAEHPAQKPFMERPGDEN